MSRKSHFLEPLLARGAGPHVIRLDRTGQVIASHLELTLDSAARRRGLLGRTSLEPDAVLILAPCNAIHMFFMKFPIDVVFADRDGKVTKLCRDLRPWRIGVSLTAFAALEFASGLIERSELALGDRLIVTPAPRTEG